MKRETVCSASLQMDGGSGRDGFFWSISVYCAPGTSSSLDVLPTWGMSGMPERKVHVVVVTGLSGSGKSTAIKAFEDLGYFCIDNLPVPLLPNFLALCEKDMPDLRKIALGIDIRERKFIHAYDT